MNVMYVCMHRYPDSMKYVGGRGVGGVVIALLEQPPPPFSFSIAPVQDDFKEVIENRDNVTFWS